MPKFKECISVNDAIKRRCIRKAATSGAPPVKVGESNVRITLRNEPNGKVIEERNTHNIFLDYGREWLAELLGLDGAAGVGVPYRNDRVAYMAFGIGGTSQLIASPTIRATWTGFPNAWGYTDPAIPATGGYGSTGGAAGDPAQTDTDPAVTGLEYPVQVEASDYYDVLSATTFPEAGVARFRAIVGYNQISFGAAVSVPLSEVGLFTEAVPFQDVPPLDSAIEVTPPIPPKPPLGVRYMVAYNTFDTLSKTSAFVLQVDWEFRIA